MSIFKKAIQLIVGDPDANLPILAMPKRRPTKRLTERELLQLESEIGATIFGDLPQDHHRQFFCLDETTWIWHEEKKNPKTGKLEQHTIRYEVQDNAILKIQEGARYSYLEGEELTNLITAIRIYHERVMRDIYQLDPHTGQALA